MKSTQSQIRAIQESIQKLSSDNSDDGLLSNLKQNVVGLSHFKDKISHYVETLNGLVNDFLTLLALFAFNTVFIPILFLYLGTKGFKLIWQIKPSGLVERAREKVKNEF